jgi:hypothetical protein
MVMDNVSYADQTNASTIGAIATVARPLTGWSSAG